MSEHNTVSNEAGSVNMFVMVVAFVLSIFLPISIYLAIRPSDDDSVKPPVSQVTSEFSNQSIDNQP